MTDSKNLVRPWNTWRATLFWFALFFCYGVYQATREFDWNAGFEFKVAIISQGVGSGLIPGIIAAAVCLVHNRRVARRIRANMPSLFD